MKITIDRSLDINTALVHLSAFLSQKAKNYPVIKSPMTLYVSFSNHEGASCDGNAKEYRIESDGQIVDVTEEIENQLKERALERLQFEIQRLLQIPKENAAKIANAEENYQQAITKGFSTSEKWMAYKEHWSREIKEVERNQTAYQEIQKKAKTGEGVRWYFRRAQGRNVPPEKATLICGTVCADGRKFLFNNTLKEVTYQYRLTDDDFVSMGQ